VQLGGVSPSRADDRRAVVIVAEVESAAARPIDDDLVSLLADAACGIALGTWLLNGVRDRAIALRPVQGEVQGVPRYLIGDWLALDFIGIKQPPAIALSRRLLRSSR
jgi:hypothetical protein